MDTHPPQLKSNGQIMTEKQIRNVVTPYEFAVSDDIIGLKLGRPARRASAMGLDLILVVMLTHLPSVLLAVLGVIFFWRAGKKKNTPSRFGWLRTIMKGIAAVLLFGVLIAVFDTFNGPQQSHSDSRDTTSDVVTGIQGLGIAAVMIGMSSQLEELDERIVQQRCQPLACWQAFLTPLSEKIRNGDFPRHIISDMKDTLRAHMQQSLTQEQTAQLLERFDEQTTLDLDTADVQTMPVVPATTASSVPAADIPVNDNGDPSLLAWVRGLLEDLGIGFGWAALYFTACTYWMKGQTPGKMLLGLRVIKLDGSAMSLWESFERYGGYGAGLATGLLGFAQVLWEPNRQAIHDKISGTLVIRPGLEKLNIRVASLNDL
ncbi:RDD family protein [Alteromonas halophila]|uniref:RDD domain protein n=1 Tax=Alteromonas halophila TaxID=516698 RepID=A0A918MXW4_9ALTE|nr:RDD family protein [Alteromonas halophila]GGW85807.1 RDD domain protein [Alteromonas halophila]